MKYNEFNEKDKIMLDKLFVVKVDDKENIIEININSNIKEKDIINDDVYEDICNLIDKLLKNKISLIHPIDGLSELYEE